MELGITQSTNIHNTRSLIRTLKYVLDILQTEEAFTVEEYKHTHTHMIQHEYNTTQHEATRVQHEYNSTNTSTTRPIRSTKKALAGKIGLHFGLFVTELYIFLISFRNS